MTFLLVAHDGRDPEALARRTAARPAHLALGDEMRSRGELLYGIALLDPAGEMCGSVEVLELPDRESVNAYLAREPYVTGKVWVRWEVQPCRVGPSFVRLGNILK